MVDITAHHIKQGPLACGLGPGHRCFDHMACTVKFMTVAQIGPAPTWLHPDVPAVAIAIGLLQAGIHVDQRIDISLEAWVALAINGIGRSLDHLGQIAVPEHLGGHGPGGEAILDHEGEA